MTGTYGIEIHYPDGTTGMTFGDAAPSIGSEIAPGWFATEIRFAKRHNDVGAGVDFDVSVAAERPQSSGENDIIAS